MHHRICDYLSALDLILEAIVAIVVVLLLVIVFMYNGFISKRNRVQDAWAQIDVQLKRRADLIPNLISTVKGYAGYERSVLTKVTELRSSIVSGSVQQKADANNQLSQALKSIFAVAENYPDLKASQNFQMLQQELEGTEDKIAFVRTSYNDYVLDYNNAIQTFPGNVFANTFHFARQDFFQAPDEAREPVKADFSDLNAPDAPAPSAPAPKAPRQQPKGPR
ncbi:MAG: LemA family protein [Candidatus Micrarchaeota archaeon]|nr:LemA family protein [Candidatus Micrarchaeota archaeon]